jgi:hypothetical protein
MSGEVVRRGQAFNIGESSFNAVVQTFERAYCVAEPTPQ